MSSVNVSILGRDYKIACDDGQEGHLRMLGVDLDKRLKQLAMQMGDVKETYLHVMVSILMLDELNDTKIELDKLRRQVTSTSQSYERSKLIELESTLSNTIHNIASRIERIAGSME